MKSRRAALALLLVIGTVGVLCSAAWIILPDPLSYIPIQVRVRLPDEVIAFISTPIPTALPPPLAAPETNLPILVLTPLQMPSATPSPTATGQHQDLLPQTFTPSAKPTSEATATATLTQTPSPTPTPTLSPQILLDGIEIIAQQFNNCGPANLTVVLNFYNQGLNQSEVGEVLKPGYDDRNVSPEELASYVNNHTPLRAATYSGGDIDLLKQLIAGGFPVIIERGFMPSENIGWMGHYLTLFGYDDFERVFTSMDTYLGPWDSSGKPQGYDSIEQMWQHFNNTFIVVFDPMNEQTLAEILGSNYLLPGNMWLSAAIKAQKETETEPQNAFAWFNLGTSLTRLGVLTAESEYYDNAALAFDRAREIGLPWRMLWYQFDPYTAYLEVGRTDEILALTTSAQDVEETHLYRGHALLATGDSTGAASAYRRALQINPNYSDASDALETLSR